MADGERKDIGQKSEKEFLGFFFFFLMPAYSGKARRQKWESRVRWRIKMGSRREVGQKKKGGDGGKREVASPEKAGK